MLERHWERLEFPKILALLAGETTYAVGRELALQLRPMTTLQDAERAQQATQEARRLLDLRPGLSLGKARDVRALARRASMGGVLTPGELLDVADTAAVARSVKGTIDRLADELPVLGAIARRLRDHGDLEEAIRRAIGDGGEVLDEASPALQRLRQDLRKTHDRLMARLQEIVNSPAYRSALQDGIITLREGRYVVPVKVECRGQIKGIVHDRSASGQTLFVEPMAVVDLQNRWRELQREEQEEIDRVLRALSKHVGRTCPELLGSIDALAEIDLHLAKARLAAKMLAVRPVLLDFPRQPRESVVRLVQARHPLLRGEVVPLTIEIGSTYDTVVITGPNTGGKTVALKTIGLLALMAQCGLQIPAAEGSTLRVFDGIYADIGDEQSIEQNLSTFSSHLTHVVEILDRATDRSLVLLDEIGAGTDPEEGSALAQAILAELGRRGSTVVATTHYAALKTFAQAHPRMVNAAVEFDVATLAPTYRLVVGLPGRSNALAIAARLGLAPRLLDEAQQYLAPAHREAEDLLEELHRHRLEAEAQRRQWEEASREVERLRRRLQQELRGIEERRREILDQARQEADALVADVRREAQRLLRELRSRRGQLHEVEALARESLSLKLPEVAERSTSAPSAPVAVGARLHLPHLGVSGTVLNVDEHGRAEIDVRGMRVRMRLDELADAQPVTDEPREHAVSYREVLDRRSRDAIALQIDLRGQRVAEALEALDRYLHDAFLAGLRRVRIVHGKGTGAVRKAVRDYLAGNPLVQDFETAAPDDGGDGATIVRLAS